MYKAFVQSKDAQKAMEGEASTFSSLSFITTLKKLCSHPALVVAKCQEQGAHDVLACLPASYSSKTFQPELSGKMLVLDTMLAMLKSTTDDRVVLVSNYTQVRAATGDGADVLSVH